MGEKDVSYKPYDHSEELGAQVSRVNHVITHGLIEAEYSEMQDYMSNVLLSLMSLDAMVDPLKPDDYEDPFDDLNFAAMNRKEQMSWIKDTYRKLTSMMHDEGLFYVRYSDEKMGKKNKLDGS